MKQTQNHLIRRVAAMLLAVILLLGAAPALASPAPGSPQQQEIAITLSYTPQGGSVTTRPADPVTYPGYENAFWLYISLDAQQDQNATITVSDLFSKYPGGVSLPLGNLASAYYSYNADRALDGVPLEFYGLGPNGEILATFRLFISLGAEQPDPPAAVVQPADITVRYVDAIGNELASETRTLNPGANTVTPDGSKVPANYTLQGLSEVVVNVGEFGADQPVVTFTYALQIQPVDITVRYVDANGNELASETRTLNPGANTVTPDGSKVPANYTLQGPGEVVVNVGEFGADQPVVTFTYALQIQPVDITVRYVDANGNELASETRTLNPGANTVTPDGSKVPANYTLQGPNEVVVNVGEFGADQPVVTFTYTLQIQPVDITVRYVDAIGNELASESRTLNPGANTVTPDGSKVPANYTLQGPNEVVVNVNESGADQPVVTFTYALQVQPAQVTIHFVNETGQPVASSITTTVNPGTSEVYAQPEDLLPGYTLAGPDVQSVTVDEQGAHPAEVSFVYKAPEATEQPIPDAQVVVSYVNEAGGTIADQQTLTLRAGTTTLTPTPANLLPGYELVGQASYDVVVDLNGANPGAVSFVYRLTPPVSQPVNVTVSYVDAQGMKVATDTVSTFGEGTHGVSPAPTDLAEGYALRAGEDAVKYVTVTQNQATPESLTFVYEKIAEATATPVPAAKAALVNVIYRNEAGETLYTTTAPCKEGEQTVIAVDLSQVNTAVYQLVGEATQVVTVDASGNPSQREVVFVFHDITLKTADIVIHYRDEAGNPLSASQSLTLEPGTHPIKPTPDSLPAGYVLTSPDPVEVVLSPTGVLSQEEVIFTYARPATATPEPTQTPEPTVIPFDVTTMDRYAYPTNNEINFRSSPNSTLKDNILKVVSQQDLAHILGSVKNQQGEEWYLADINGQEGFLKATVVRLLEFNEAAALFGWTPQPSPTPTPSSDQMSDGEIIDRWAEVTDRNGVNFRTKASATSSKIGTLDLGERFWVYTQQTVGADVWYSIMANGKTGYVMAKYTRLFSLQESQQYQATLATPMPYAVTPSPSPAPETSAPATQTPPPVTDAPATASPPPQAYYGPALTIRQTALRTGVSQQDEPVMEMLEADTLVQVWNQTWIGSEGWSQVQVMADKQVGYVPNSALRYINEQEANFYLAKLQPQATATPVPTRQPDQRTGYSITRGENVPMRAFPDTNAQIVALLPESAVVAVRGQEYTAGATWDVVQYGIHFGYVRSDQLRILSAAEEQNYLDSLRTPTPAPAFTPQPVTLNSPSSYGFVNTDRVRLRSQPSTDSRELKLMGKNAFALIYGSVEQPDGTWYHISQDGTVGYIHGNYFSVLPMGELSNYLQSPDYLNANSANNPAGAGYQQQSQITPLESYNATVWQNPSLINASYEPFNPLGSPTPGVEAILTPSPSASLTPSPTLMTVEAFEEPLPEKTTSRFPTGWVVLGLAALLGGGGYYAYHLYNQNQKRAAARAAQRRAQAAQQAGAPQARLAPQQPSPYAPPRPGQQGTPYKPQGEAWRPGGNQPQPPTQGTAQYRPQGMQGQPQPPTQGTVQYRPQGMPGQPQPPVQGTTQYRPQGMQGQPQPPTQGTAQYRPQGAPGQPQQPAQGTQDARPAPETNDAASDSARRRRSDRHGNT